jgi:hypothetical protein
LKCSNARVEQLEKGLTKRGKLIGDSEVDPTLKSTLMDLVTTAVNPPVTARAEPDFEQKSAA